MRMGIKQDLFVILYSKASLNYDSTSLIVNQVKEYRNSLFQKL